MNKALATRNVVAVLLGMFLIVTFWFAFMSPEQRQEKPQIEKFYSWCMRVHPERSDICEEYSKPVLAHSYVRGGIEICSDSPIRIKPTRLASSTTNLWIGGKVPKLGSGCTDIFWIEGGTSTPVFLMGATEI